MYSNHKKIINSILVQLTTKQLLNNSETEVLERPGSYVIRVKIEPEDKLTRIILLPPHGFTSNKINELRPHPEVRKATIEIKGGVRLNKSGFNPIKNALKYEYYKTRAINNAQNGIYPEVDKENKLYAEEIKSAKDKFYVVKEDGVGFYHNLVNLTNEWILLILEKELRLQKTPNLQPLLNKVNENEKKIILEFYEKIHLLGDDIFEKEKQVVQKMSNLSINSSMPALIEMLNTFETGKHEACTIYAIILKIGKQNRETINYLKLALEKNQAPTYYLDELIKKLDKKIPVQ